MKPLALATFILGIVNVVSASLILQFTDIGVTGVCLSWVFSMILLKLVFYPIFCHSLTGGSYKRYYMPILDAHLAFFGCAIVLYAISLVFVPPMTWIGILVPFFLLFLLFFILEMRFMFSRRDMEMIRTYLPRFIQRFMEKVID